MKEIKIRYIWRRIKNKRIFVEIVPLDCLEHKGDCPFAHAENCGWEIIARDLFLGLYDKKGKEIYEGDILLLKSKLWDFKKVKNVWEKEVVGIRCTDLGNIKAYFDIDMVKKWYNYGSYEDWIADWEDIDNKEVIGNMYENSNLLKELK